MTRADELRAQLAVAELEEQLVAAKDANGSAHPDLKAELRYQRWVARGGPAEEQELLTAGDDHTNRAVADLYARWSAEQKG
jgi:hypothetical protein